MTECVSLDEVRANIDGIDRQIVRLISERGRYVRQAARFKKSADDVRTPKRVEEVVREVRGLAVEYKASAELVEQVYRTMIAGFVALELSEHTQQTESPATLRDGSPACEL